MRNVLRSIIVFLVATLFIMGITSCEQVSENVGNNPISIAVVFSNREGNSISPFYFDVQLNGEKESLLYKAAAPGSEMVVITSSGLPVQSQKIIMPPSDAVTKEQAKSDQDYYAEKNKEIIMNTYANAPEADIFEALKLAANWLGNQPNEQQKYCLVIDNGICTTGTLSFLQDGFLMTSPEVIIQKIADKNALPDLSGVTVVFSGLGRTANPQEEPKESAYRNLKTLWESIVTNAGGTAIIREERYEEMEIKVQYLVSSVKFPSESPTKFESVAYNDNFEKPQFLSEDQVKFIGDTADYVDPLTVIDTITPIAKFMNENPSFQMLLVGTTAGDENNEYCITLSQNRANAVKNSLVLLGVNSSQIVTKGLGNSNPWHIYNAGFESDDASRNRKVVFLSADSDEAKMILEQYK